MTIEWKESAPPQSCRGRKVWAPIVDELKIRPGVWAIVRRIPVGDHGEGINGGHRSAALSALKKLGAEGHTIRNGDVVEVWARWPESAPNPPATTAP